MIMTAIRSTVKSIVTIDSTSQKPLGGIVKSIVISIYYRDRH